MNLENLISISGMPGLFKVVGQRSNGLIVQDLDTNKSKFVSSRKYSFMPLESIGIFTYNETAELSDIFQTMKDQLADNPPPEIDKATPLEISEYFESILPEYDDDRVKVGDMKKVIKWFLFLQKREMVDSKSEEVTEEP